MNITVLGGRVQFSDFISKIPGVTLSRHERLDRLLTEVESRETDAIFILPDYEGGKLSVSEFSEDDAERLSKIISDGKTKIYIENYPSFDYRDMFIFGLQARGLLNNVGKLSLACGRIYDKMMLHF